MVVDLVAVSIAVSAGALTFASPCAVSLLPAYAAYFVGVEDDEPVGGLGEATRAGVRFAGAAAGGIVVLFALAGLGLYALRRWIDPRAAGLGDAVVYLGLVVGAILVVLGVLMLLDVGLEVTVPLPAPQRKTVASMAGFGIVFAAGSVGCSLPIFFNVVVQALAQGPLGAFVTFLAYGGSLAALMVLVGVGLSIAEEQVRQHVRSVTPYVRPAAGVVLVLGGLYTAWYYWAVLTV